MSEIAERPLLKVVLPDLPYPLDALEPHISRETLEFHHGRHHRGYVAKLNRLLESGEHRAASLEDLVRESTGAVFNNAAQAWNHAFYWNCLSPGAGRASGPLLQALEAQFGSYPGFVEQFTQAAVGKFGSGWTWLVQRADGSLAIRNTDDADNPLRHGESPLLTCDVWEHAYYLDYRNDRSKYLTAFFKVLHWDFASRRFARP